MWLFATDFGVTAKAARQVLMQLQSCQSQSVHLLHVLPSLWRAWLNSGLQEKEALQRLEIWQLKVNSKHHDSEFLHIRKGLPGDIILKTAEQFAVDTIILGTGDLKVGVRHAGKAVLKRAKQSVLLCKSKTINNILCGIDGSPMSAKALHKAIALAHCTRAKLTVVYVLSRPPFNPTGLSPTEIGTKEETHKQTEITKIQTFLQDFDFSGIEVDIIYPWGTPEHVILHLAEDFDHDLIVLGAKGFNKVKDMVLGSTAERILHCTPCSLMVVR